MWSCRVSFANFMLNARRQSSPHLAHLATQSFSISKIEPFTPSHSFSQQLLARFVGIVYSLDPFWKTKRASPYIPTRNCLSRSFLVLPWKQDLEQALGEWNTVQATLRQVSTKLSRSMLALGASCGASLLLLAEYTFFHSESALFDDQHLWLKISQRVRLRGEKQTSKHIVILFILQKGVTFARNWQETNRYNAG